MPGTIDISLDFKAVQRAAEQTRDLLTSLRQRFDLSPFEYARQIRIAPMEIPHSHPQITLNKWSRDAEALLATYLHEQMHWYATWYSHANSAQWLRLLRRLGERYADVPVGGSEGAQDEYSTYLHLMVNWLEIETTSRFLDRDRVQARTGTLPYYRWVYRTVLADWDPLLVLYQDHGLLPIKPATAMSAEELTLAALPDDFTPAPGEPA